MSFDFSEINIWAALVAAIASFIIGGLWYAVLFGKAWQKAYAFTEDDFKKMSAHPERTYPVMFICDVLTAFVVALLAMNIGIESVGGGIALGVVLWAGIAGAITLATQLGSGRPVQGWVIDTGKQLASLIVIGAIVGGWR